MTRDRKIKTRMNVLIFILTIMLPSIFIIVPMNTNNSKPNFNEFIDEIDNIKSPQPSKISTAPWWDGSWRYRRLINVTNPNVNFDFTNYTTTVVFNYTVHTAGGAQYKMNGDLSDMRIVQDGVLRKYYYKQDYPNTDLVTVWFDVDIGKSPNNIDTDNVFLYFNGSGKETVDPNYYMDTASNNKKDAMGWVRNGDFELDYVAGDKIWGAYGWTYTNEAPVSFDDGSGALENSANYVHKLTDSNDYQERAFGDWSFKWGDTGQFLRTENDPEDGNDFEGTLYSYPFIVPTVEGIGVNLELEVYRNFRCYTSNDAHLLGYYMRLCEDYSSNVNGHTQYILEEQYRSVKSPAATYVIDEILGSNLFDTRNDASEPFENDGEITGTVKIDLDADDMGKLLFLVIGTYGKESEKHAAFTQVDSVSFNYDINTALNEDVQEVAGEATFITKDVDGRIVPNAEVTIMEEFGTPTTIGPYETSEEDGSVSFSNVAYGTYNVTVNYTIPYSGLEAVVYDSRIITKEFLIDGSGRVYELTLNMSTIDFEFVDDGGNPLAYGYVNVSYSKGGPALDILKLSDDGTATFRWLNRSYYYYQVYYNNTDYSTNPTPLNASYIRRENYEKYPGGDKQQFHTLDINQNNQEPTGLGQFNVKERIYTNGSRTQITDVRLLNVSITIQNNEFLESVSIYYIDSADNTGTLSHRIFFDDSYVAETGDNIKIDLMTVVNSKLSSENRLAYGLLIDVWGVNSSICTGVIEINMTESWHVFNKTGISRLNIRVLGDGATISDAIVTIKSVSPIFGSIVTTTLISDKNRNSYAFTDNDLPFMFLRGYYYNFTVIWEGATILDMFNVSGPDPDQWAPNNYVSWYNYSLLKYDFTLEFDINMMTANQSDYKLKFDDLSSPESVVWGNNVTVQVYFNKTVDNWVTYSAVTTPESILLKIQRGTEVLFTFNMESTGTPGYYMKEFNSSILSAGIAGIFYRLVITGTKTPYVLQSIILTTLFVQGKATVLSMHDYYDSLNPITGLSQNYGELVNLTVKYYNNSDSPLKGATITYEWLSLPPIHFYEDPINIGYYTTTIDTSLAEVWGSRTILITASLENYTTKTLLTSISIAERPTLLNGTNNVIFLSEDVFALESEYIEFDYTDVLSSTRIANLDEASYNWQKLDENNDPIPGENKIGDLIETADHRYILDLNTEFMELGDYFVFITLNKLNYELRTAVVSLTIENRPTSVNGTIGAYFINMGESLNFTYSYIDDLTSTSITNLGTQSYTINGTLNTSGSLGYDSNKEVYYLIDFDAASLLDGNYTIKVSFDKENYTSQVVVSTLVVNFVETDYRSYLTLISQEPLNLTTAIFWRDEVKINFSFTTQFQDETEEFANPTTITLQFLDESFDALGSSINLINDNYSKGKYSYNFSTSQFLFIGGESYYMRIRASKTTPMRYTPPDPLVIFFKVQSVETTLTIHNYTTWFEFPSYTITKYWNQTFGITLYYSESISSTPITNANVMFSWAYGTGTIDPDVAKGPGYYSFFFDTGDVTETGTYIISILAVKQNFSNGIPSSNLLINIINRPTSLNSNDDVLYIRHRFHVLDSVNYTFEFIDVLTSKIIKYADEKSFILHKRDESGDPILGSTIIGVLHETANHQYILDVNTEKLRVGEYSVVVTLRKENHDIRVAIMSLTIDERVFSSDYTVDSLISLVSGENLRFIIQLTDPYNNSALISGATLSLILRGINYNTISGGIIDNGDGTYTVNTFPVAKPFFMSETFIAILTIEKANYTSETLEFTVVVSMEEIFPGMPTFYFILITGSIIGILGSVVGYRVIQQARIPKHVKKIRKVKKLIKAKKSMEESINVPTKEEMMFKLFGREWREIGLSLNETLGIQDLKSKRNQIKEKATKDESMIDKLVKEKMKKEKENKDKIKKEKLKIEKSSEDMHETKTPEKVPKEDIPEETLSKDETQKEGGDED